MLTLLSALDERIEGKGSTTERARMTLPPDVKNDLRDLFSEIRGDVVDPFFKIDDMQLLDKKWESWVEWFSPLMEKLVERIIPLFANDVFRRQFAELQPMALAEIEGYVRTHSEALAQTFSLAIKTGLYADALLIPKIGLVTPLGESIKNLLEKRAKQGLAFGLALILVIDSMDRGDMNREKARFLVLKMKRAAANLYVHTSTILNALEHSGQVA